MDSLFIIRREECVMRRREVDQDQLRRLYEAVLYNIGLDTESDEHLADTPRRMAGAIIELTRGLDGDVVASELTTFSKACEHADRCDNMISLGGAFDSLCAHHFLPFHGEYILCYIPGEWIIGASKVERIMQVFSARPQGQEQLVHDVADAFEERVQPSGLALWTRATHDCMRCRGVRANDSWMEMRLLRGRFLTEDALKQEFNTTVLASRMHGRGINSNGGDL